MTGLSYSVRCWNRHRNQGVSTACDLNVLVSERMQAFQGGRLSLISFEEVAQQTVCPYLVYPPITLLTLAATISFRHGSSPALSPIF